MANPLLARRRATHSPKANRQTDFRAATLFRPLIFVRPKNRHCQTDSTSDLPRSSTLKNIGLHAVRRDDRICGVSAYYSHSTNADAASQHRTSPSPRCVTPLVEPRTPSGGVHFSPSLRGAADESPQLPGKRLPAILVLTFGGRNKKNPDRRRSRAVRNSHFSGLLLPSNH